MDEEIEKLRTRVARKVSLRIFRQCWTLLQGFIIKLTCKTFRWETDFKNRCNFYKIETFLSKPESLADGND